MEPALPDHAASSLTEAQRFASAVLSARTQRQMSRVALAEQAGVSLQIVEDLERGYPVAREVVAAICRNLDLPEPALDANPVVRLALRVRERRGLARLSRAQLAARAGVTSQVIRSIEAATLWPSQELCMALLSVKSMELQESDVAAFLCAPSNGTGSEAAQNSGAPPSMPLGASAPRERPGSSRLPPGRPALSQRTGSVRTSRGPLGNQVVATFLVRFFANGKVSLEMRPTRAKRGRNALPAEARHGPSRTSPRPS